MDKEQLKKLAEVAGSREVCFSPLTKQLQGVPLVWFDEWQPHKDITQAFEVLEGLISSDGLVDYYHMVNDIGNTWRCFLHMAYDSIEICQSYSEESLPDAICKAVLKATEQG